MPLLRRHVAVQTMTYPVRRAAGVTRTARSDRRARTDERLAVRAQVDEHGLVLGRGLALRQDGSA